MTTSIYTLSEEGNREVRYIGASTKPKQRLAMHRYSKGTAEGAKKQKWVDSVKASGGQIEMTIIEQCEDSQTKGRETFWIDYYVSLGCKLTNTQHNNKTGSTPP